MAPSTSADGDSMRIPARTNLPQVEEVSGQSRPYSTVRLSPIRMSPDGDQQTELSYIAFEPEEQCHDPTEDVTNGITHNKAPTIAGSQTFRAPHMTFLPTNRIQTELAPKEANALMQRIINKFYVLLGPLKRYHLDVIVWKRSADFFSWYMVEEGIEVSVLRFAIFNAHSDFEKEFYITKGDEQSFQALKQYVWDFFWVSSKSNPGDFKVQVMTNPLPREIFRYSLTGASVVASNSGVRDFSSLYEHNAPVVVRLQTDDTGRLSHPYDKFVLGHKYTVARFFSWFTSETSFGAEEGPLYLKFTFMNVMPVPVWRIIERSNQSHFDDLQKELLAAAERTNKFFPGQKEFCVVVSVPGWEAEEYQEC
ncbi:MAG: hypothetical protein CL912_11690 [Deltaproteobacteria bacterium]|nr:hypothetical protein [Deltaproteobacteria bacterium]